MIIRKAGFIFIKKIKRIKTFGGYSMKVTLYKVVKGFRYLRHYGWKEFLVRVQERLEPDEVSYESWYEKHKVTGQILEQQRTDSDAWEERPLVSICVPVYQTPEVYLRQMIVSVQQQSYTNWQLCLADGSMNTKAKQIVEEYQQKDKRIKYTSR